MWWAQAFGREWGKAAQEKKVPKLDPPVLPPSSVEFRDAQRVLGTAVPIARPAERSVLMTAMKTGPRMNGFAGMEAYLWFVHAPIEGMEVASSNTFATFKAGCPTRVRSGVYGCL